MSSTSVDPATLPVADNDEDAFYVIELYTWTHTETAAKDLAVRLAGVIGDVGEVDIAATTVRPEVDTDSDHERVFETEDPPPGLFRQASNASDSTAT